MKRLKGMQHVSPVPFYVPCLIVHASRMFQVVSRHVIFVLLPSNGRVTRQH